MRLLLALLTRAQPLLAALSGVAAGMVIVVLTGESPLFVMEVLVSSAFGSRYDFAMTLFYSTPLIFTGLSVSLAFRAGLFNIGAEGQLAVGAFCAAAIGAMGPELPLGLSVVLAVLAACVGGAVWGFVPGYLRAKRGSHEVITTIMLNFVAAGLTSYFTLYWLKNPESQNPETSAIQDAYVMVPWDWADGAPLSGSILIALFFLVLVWIGLTRSVQGFRIRAVGENSTAAAAAGISVSRVQILAMTLAGGLAGLVGVGEVLSNALKFKMGFSPGYGFIGIAVALLGRGKPIGVLLSAILFGALHKGTADLDFETDNISRDFSLILQAFVILFVAADGLWLGLRRRLEERVQQRSLAGKGAI